MNRLAPDYRNINGLQILDAEDLQVIEIKAKAMDLAGCLDFLCLDLADLPTRDLRFATLAWKRGRAEGIAIAADRMFAAMQQRNGGQVALEYLKHLSSTFKIEPDSASAQTGFSFNVTLD